MDDVTPHAPKGPESSLGAELQPLTGPHLFRAAVESAPIGMVMINAEGSIVLVNAETEKLFGYKRSEMLAQPIEMLVPERFRSQHPVLRTGFFSVPTARRMGAGRDLFALRKDGSEFPVEIGLNPVSTAEGVFVLGAIVDITRRKRLEARFRATIESAPMAMAMINQEGSIILVNAETEKLFGYSRGEMLHQSIEMLVPLRFRGQHPGHRVGFFSDPSARRMGAGRDLFGLRKDGSEFPVEIGLNPVETEEGMFVLSAIVDITERKRLEEKLLAANEALEESNVELQQFAYVASHDLQTPLRGVTNFAQFLQSDYKGKLSDEADELLQRIVDGCGRMRTMINDLLSYSSVDSRAKPFESINLQEVVDDVIGLLEIEISEGEGEVTRGPLPTVPGDRLQLTQLFQNLIGNGLKYRGQAPPQVHVSSETTDKGWVISISDNGIGIDPKHHEKVFEVFRRLHTQDKYPGTGIGLGICRRIVQRHRGRIWVESVPGEGTTMRFTLLKPGTGEE